MSSFGRGIVAADIQTVGEVTKAVGRYIQRSVAEAKAKLAGCNPCHELGLLFIPHEGDLHLSGGDGYTKTEEANLRDAAEIILDGCPSLQPLNADVVRTSGRRRR